MRKLLSLLIVFFLFAAFFYFAKEHLNIENYIAWYKSTPKEKLNLILDNDFESSLKKNEFPKEWFSLVGYKVIYHTALCEYFFKGMRIPVPQNNKGAYYAKIDVVDIPDAEKPGFLLQISLIHRASNNKVEEFSKDYYLNDLEKLPEFARIHYTP